MGKRVKVNKGFIGVWLGNGFGGYDEDDEVVLSDRQYERLSAGVKTRVLEVLAEVDDPQGADGTDLATQAELDAALLSLGVRKSVAGSVVVAAAATQSVFLTDEDAEENSGNGATWRSGTADGDPTQGFAVATGDEGAHSLEFLGDGVLRINGVDVLAAINARLDALEAP